MPTVQDRWINKVVGGNRYVVSEKLGEGGMGAVYLAEDRNLQNWVVIKTPHPSMLRDPEFAARFKREVRSLVTLSHPHIVKVLDVGQHGDIPFAVMEFLPGGSLESRLFGNAAESHNAVWQPPPIGDVCEWLTQIAAALDFIHGKGFIHRDVKPANILFDQSSHAYLTDFGVAKVLAQVEASPKPKLTATGMVMGTAEYMAPELLQGKPFDHCIDQYALAVTVFEALSGTRPYDGATPAAVALAQVQQPIPMLHEHTPCQSKVVSDVLGRALALSPEQRFQSCSEFANALTQTVGAPAAEKTPQIDSKRVRKSTLNREARHECDSGDRPRRVTGREAMATDGTAQTQTLHERLQTEWNATSRRARAAILCGVFLLTGAISLGLWSLRDRPRASPAVTGTNVTDPAGSVAGNASGEKTQLPPDVSGNTQAVESLFRRPSAPPPSNGPPRTMGTNAGEVRDDNGLRMKLVWCPAGSFQMGSPPSEPGRIEAFEQQVSVTLTRGFWIGKFEATQQDWWQLFPETVDEQSQTVNGEICCGFGPQYPVHEVNYEDIGDFLQKMNEQERQAGRLPAGMIYRLPTEAEWEYACRAGTTTPTAFGDSLSRAQANFNGAKPYNGGALGAQTSLTVEVGRLPANAWQIHDMHGNVKEFCADEKTYQLPGGVDPFISTRTASVEHCVRGGGWVDEGAWCRSSYRFWFKSDWRSVDLGFRVVLGAELDPSKGATQTTSVTKPAQLPVSPSGNKSPLTLKTLEGRKAGDEWADNGLKMRFIWCPPGKFLMGSPPSEPGRLADEKQVSVTLTHGFWIGKSEVTQQEWGAIVPEAIDAQAKKVYGTILPGRFGPRFPIVLASFQDMTEFLERFNAQERRAGLLPSGLVYRLPTEAEWEYACRAGTLTATAFGNSLSSTQANFNGMQPYNGGAIGPYRTNPVEVGSFSANAWGIHDMHGNVREFCADRYQFEAPGGVDPFVSIGTKLDRVSRGGDYGSSGYFCRSALRNSSQPDKRHYNQGFRVVLGSPIAFDKTTTSNAPSTSSAGKGNTSATTSGSAPPTLTWLFEGKRAGQERNDNSLEMKFCWCPPGTFRMGSPANEAGRNQDEGQVEVTLTSGFWMGKYEVAQAEWKKVGPLSFRDFAKEITNGSYLFGVGNPFPMYYINHDDCHDFCRRLTTRERQAGHLPKEYLYRLPTEAEWEYACRAGTTTATSFGDTLGAWNSNLKANFAGSRSGSGSTLKATIPVGSFDANRWGLHDLHGNVWEWCADSYGKELPGGRDPFVDTRNSSQQRVIRGGAWNTDRATCRSAARGSVEPKLRDSTIGFRVVLVRELK